MPGSSVPPAAEVVPRLHVRDPDAWLRLACWIVVGLSALQILVFSFGRDQGIYALVGEGLLHGKLPYRDLWDFKPPGIFFVYALAQGVFGKTMLAPRLLEVCALIGLVYCSGRLSQTWFAPLRISPPARVSSPTTVESDCPFGPGCTHSPSELTSTLTGPASICPFWFQSSGPVPCAVLRSG